MWIGGTPMHAKGFSHSLLRPVADCPVLGPVQKQVSFDLADDLGDSPSLPMDLASFLGEDVTNVKIDTPHPLAPLTIYPPQLPCHNGDQHHSTHMGGAHPKPNNAKPKATS